MKSVEVIVSPEGEISVEAVGFKGQACESATAAIEQALGVARSKRKKQEYYQHTAATSRQRASQ